MLWKEEFKRNFFNRKTILVIAILITIGFISIYFSYKDKQEYIRVYEANYEDVNQKIMYDLIQNYNGTKFDLDFMLYSDFADIYIITLLLFCGIFLSSHIIEMMDNGQENYILTRTSYKQHLISTIKSQSLYIFLIVLISMIVILIMGAIVGGKGSGYCDIGEYTVDFMLLIPISIYQILIISINIILINSLSLLLCSILNKKIIIQLFPFLGFTIVPMIISSTIGNIFTTIGRISALFVPFRNLKNLYWILQSNFDISEIILTVLPYFVYIIFFIILYKKNKDKYSEDCV